ncbi:restriction endonuclease subunit S [Sulfurimonas sp. RIFOXYB12_FULL_35_9]|uniref:restriction endonuclease subunit S n=1 Tax=Sulfurimonas sp. RIFOXYB12_FULL_35_9 TaxID=1802256 RepID=UPI000B1DB482|nr:restriction endonuclease subunit S [Sulfurimonas sp. RIFOXYB12_FULL_35_9]
MKNSPKLRFPEFVNDKEWEEKTLGKCLLKHPDYGVNAAAVPFSKNLPTYLRITDISVDGYYLNNEKVSVNIDATSDNYLEEGDIVLARTGASVGKSYKYRKEDGALVFAGFLIRVKPDKTKLNSDLLFHFLSTEKYWKWVNVVSARSGQPGINGNEYANLPIPIPSTLNEQQKIADCLSSVDYLISAQSQKVELLKEHKKALMQQLFPQDGEEVPKLRFPEFKNAPKWEEKFIEDFFAVGSSKRVLQEEWTSQGVPFYRTRELVSLSKNEPFGSEIFISEELFLELSKKYGIPSAGDFLVSGVGTLGICYQVQNNDKFYFKDGNVIWFKLVQKLNSNYFKYCFQSDHIQNQIFAQSSASTVGTYTIQNAKKTKFWYPPTFQEQQKIADCLISVDEQITSQNQKLQTLKEHKKALMQQLFPSKEAQ